MRRVASSHGILTHLRRYGLYALRLMVTAGFVKSMQAVQSDFYVNFAPLDQIREDCYSLYVNLNALKQSIFMKTGLRLLLLGLLLAACREEPSQPDPIVVENEGQGETAVSATNTPIPTAMPLPPRPDASEPEPTEPAPPPEPVAEGTIHELTILYTNDEHGWIEGETPEQSAAHLMGIWRDELGYTKDGAFLILSGGDMWTGPAISTWFNGKSMVEVMNGMGYSAAAVGNHEFDFGLEALQLRAEEADFPILSANIRKKSDGTVPTELGIRPYTITTVNNIQVGIIGLTTQNTPATTNPTNVSDFDFIDYETALREVVPQAKADGAELILVPGHICQHELRQLANAITDLGVHLLGGGHCNELFAEERSGIILIEGGDSMASYAQVIFQFDTATDSVVDAAYSIEVNEGGSPDPIIADITSEWLALTNDELDVVIGSTDNGVARRSPEMQSLITEAWLWAYPTGDVAITNLGGMRADIPAGEITLADLIAVMPFNNVIIDVSLSGEQLIETLSRARNAAIGGTHRSGSDWILTKTGTTIDPGATYHLLVNDFMYAGGDDFTFLAQFDPAGYDTAVNWRQPIIDWMITQDPSATSPLDEAIQQIGD